MAASRRFCRNGVDRRGVICGIVRRKEMKAMKNEKTESVVAEAEKAARYVAGQVVLADVDHVRAYRGETDELLYRMRSAEAEEEFMRVLDGLREPDWFVERWDDGRKVLVACLVFERDEDARRCEEALAASAEAGESKTVWSREDSAMREEVAAYFTKTSFPFSSFERSLTRRSPTICRRVDSMAS